MIQHTFGLLVKPSAQWRTIAKLPTPSFNTLILYPCLMALLPAIAWYYGTSRIGWSVGDGGQAIKLTMESARQISILFYLGMVACVLAIGYFVHWMSRTYGADSSFAKGIVVAGLTATPLFIAGLVGFYPVLWVDLLIGVVAISWSIYLLYLGIPIVMGIPEERGFLFSSAVVAIGLVILIGLMVTSVILWDMGAAPAFTD
ncbi:YIP1 family protein [Parahaliea sp. F7430]|uniref:YIP1 family protein n=1 Tax=Sediminihaliea albiluteola TaxID=2758564 RepID=A0A7W2TVC1_9GAMM|nr:Yip1 family protein [Sediminihaliea albiluteola]MBA6412558.1 YIP1 family protein [Sediminihaliea albiluteola]